MNTDAQARLIPRAQNGRLGLQPAIDPRDQQYPMRLALPTGIEAPAYKYWTPGQQLDQGMESSCVGYSSEGLLLSSPFRQDIPMGGSWIYHEAQRIDEFPGEAYEGTSIRAGMQVLQREGYITNYVWAWDYETIRQFLGTVGPVILGITWLNSMYQRDRNGFLVVDPSQGIAGGHAILCRGYSAYGSLRLRNSWGAWGECWLKRQDFELLMNNFYGEAVAPTEIAHR
jgi:hypothetical protein